MLRILILILMVTSAWPQVVSPSQARKATARKERDHLIAAAFAPVVYQGLGDQPRSDYITNFDFDGDWKGDNNWDHLDKSSYRLKSYVYFSVIETTTHYFVHYAFFHPRDYKGGLMRSAVIESIIKEGVRRAGTDPLGMAGDVALSHENDLEGCLVVAAKQGEDAANAVVQYVETMAHNRFLKYQTKLKGSAVSGDTVELDGQHPILFAEPKGHGVTKYTGSREQLKDSVNGTLVYSYSGKAEDPAVNRSKVIGYQLLSIFETLWPRAQAGTGETFAEVEVYQPQQVLRLGIGEQSTLVSPTIGKIGAAFRGKVGFKNKARPPWAWFDEVEKDRTRGEWFFDPVAVIMRHFSPPGTFSRIYSYHPYFKINVT